jgi:hypothetical protein
MSEESKRERLTEAYGTYIEPTALGTELLEDRRVQWEHYIGANGDHPHTGHAVSRLLGLADNIVREVREQEAAGYDTDDVVSAIALAAVREAFAYGYGAATLRAEGPDGLTIETVGTEAFDAMMFDGVDGLADPPEPEDLSDEIRALLEA